MKDNTTESDFQMNTHEFWFMLHGLEKYLATIKKCKEPPDYKLIMISTALKTSKKMEQWAAKLNWIVANLGMEDIKKLNTALLAEREKQDKKWKKLKKENGQRSNIQHVSQDH